MSRSNHARGYTHHYYGKYTKSERWEMKRKQRQRTRERMHQERWDDLDMPKREVEGYWFGW
jgi:hypothetical protein